MVEKPLIWLGDSREAISGFPDAARQIAGFPLWRVQRGLEPNDWKPMPSVGVLDLAGHRLRLLLNQRARQKG
ncbi:MAG: hypothetical protein WAP47_19440 [Candidatus Rokuibacteriota bacterium]